MAHNHPLLVWDLETSGIYILRVYYSSLLHFATFIHVLLSHLQVEHPSPQVTHFISILHVLTVTPVLSV